MTHGRLTLVESVELTENTLARTDFVTGEAFALVPIDRRVDVMSLPPPLLRAELTRAELDGLAALGHRT